MLKLTTIYTKRADTFILRKPGYQADGAQKEMLLYFLIISTSMYCCKIKSAVFIQLTAVALSVCSITPPHMCYKLPNTLFA